MSFILKFHGEIRWLVALAAVLAIGKFGLGWLRGAKFKGADRVLMAAFTGLLDLNLLLGLILLFAMGGGWPAVRLEHAVTMILAIAVAHSAAMWRKSDDSIKKFRNNLIVVVVATAFIVAGVIRLRAGWIF